MSYVVKLTDAAKAAIRRELDYIAIECSSPLNAQSWLERVWDAIDSLKELPTRFGFAAENDLKQYEVRRVLISNHLLLFTIDEPGQCVLVVGLRHGCRLPRPDDLPDVPDF